LKNSPEVKTRFVTLSIILAASPLWPVAAQNQAPQPQAAPIAAPASPLTPEQIASLREQLDVLKKTVEGRFSEMNRSAGAVFRQAAGDPKAAVELYAKCYREVNFVREGKPDSDYRDWEDKEKDNLRDPRFIQGLLVQLRYLALSCDAAEAKELDAVFPSLLAHVESLTKLTELPSQQALQGINQSVFAQAYELDELLSRNRGWEMSPFDIPGIYEKTILPHLRAKAPGQLMAAWDRRISQQTQMVGFISTLQQKGGRDDRKASENQTRQIENGRGGAVIRAHNEIDFKETTLPELQWNRLRDMARYVDQTQGLAGMLTFLREKMEHPKIADWLQDMQTFVAELGAGPAASAPTTFIPAAPPAPVIPAAVAPAPVSKPGVPRGLE
jgi:hypothetical protein